MKTSVTTFFRNILKFPIQKNELAKFICTALMLMFTVYIYSILRNTKDTLLLGYLGPELISTTKLWGVLPVAVIFMLIYTKVVNLASRTTLYHIFIWSFIGFFIVFDVLLHPNLSHLLINMEPAIQKMPYMKYMLQMIGGWPIVMFYILSELWGSMMMALMFWQLANQTTSIAESKRFYPLFLLIGQIGLLISGFFSKYAICPGKHSDPKMMSHVWQAFLNKMTFTLVISGIGLSLCLVILGKLIGKETINDIIVCGKTVKKKVRLGFGASLKYIFSSKYIGLITLLVLCYGTSINLVEGIWKASVNMQFSGDKVSMQNFFGNIQIWTAVVGIIAMYTGSHLLSLIRWGTGALFTPIMVVITGTLFYTFIIYRENEIIAPLILALGTTPLYLAVISGGIQNVLSKGIKYAFFDPTKDMSYIPLDEELRTKGKAAVEVIGGRLGKSSGAFIQWTMLQIGFMFKPDISLIGLTSYFFIIFCATLAVWFFAVRALDKKFYEKIEENKVMCANNP